MSLASGRAGATATQRLAGITTALLMVETSFDSLMIFDVLVEIRDLLALIEEDNDES